ncbi:MAG: ABC transporter ATP-binding protein [Gemmatimonadetes bacterium]|nr:ABC transporter ATP-binding protein [Gemmatimonadota bacterium]
MTALRPFVRALWAKHRRAMVALAVTTLALSLTEGAGLLLLLPMLRLAGVALNEGTSDRVASAIEEGLRVIGIAPTLVGVLAAVVLVVTARAALQFLLAEWTTRLEASVVGRLHGRLFDAIVRLPWARFTGERPAALAHALGPQVDDVQSAVMLLLEFASMAAAVTAAAVVAVTVAPALTAVVALVGVALLLLAHLLRAPGRAEADQLLHASIAAAARANELLGAMKMIHAYAAEERAVRAVAADIRAWLQLSRDFSRRRAVVALAFAVLSVLLLAVLVWIAVAVAQAAPATLLLMLLIYARLVPRLAEMQSAWSALTQALASFASLSALLQRCDAARAESAIRHNAASATMATNSRSAIPALHGTTPTVPPAPQLEVRAITVRYAVGERPVLRDRTARFPAGAVTAVIGATGAGKTTLADVLLGLLVPESGAVLVDGAPLAALSAEAWRARVGYLAQEPMLFHGTVRENLLFARPDASDDELNAALRDAACDFVERLSERLDAPIGDRGVLLSGGERQRLALARALLRQPALLVLDEATSALDADTEARILQTVRALRGRCTVVFCTHRDAVRALADAVVEL